MIKDAAFTVAFDRIIGHEGGFQDDRLDRGNWTGGRVGQGELKGTNFGLSAMTYPDEDIKGMSIDRAKEIYFSDWWKPLKMDKMPKAVTYQLFDAAINHGMHRASILLQKAVDAKPDGIIGSKTIQAVVSADLNDVLIRFLSERLRFMAYISTWPRFGKGWAIRIADNLLLAAEDN